MCNNIFCRFVVIATMFIIAGCSASTVRYTPDDFCLRPIDPNMARIVVTRKAAFFGKQAPWLIDDNKQPIGGVGNGDKLCWDRHPGTMVITVTQFNLSLYTEVFNKENLYFTEKNLVVDAKKGIEYNMEVSLDMGSQSGFQIKMIDSK